MEVLTSRFGKISFSSKEVYIFKKGIYGFSQWAKYILLKLREDEPFLWLQSVEISQLAFLLVNPLMFIPQYKVDLPTNELEEIKVTTRGKVEIFAMAKIQSESKKIQVNLLAPIIINPQKKLGKQVILKNSEYDTQHQIL